MEYSSRKKMDFLICFDNAEELISHCERDFQLFLKEITDSCPRLKIVITTNKLINPELSSIKGDTIMLKEPHLIRKVTY